MIERFDQTNYGLMENVYCLDLLVKMAAIKYWFEIAFYRLGYRFTQAGEEGLAVMEFFSHD
jgi:hypothetical protein